jgi:glutamate formiminotransferase
MMAVPPVVVTAISLLNNHAANSFMPVSTRVFNSDRMAPAEVTMVERATEMIDKSHVSAMAETHRLGADTEADVVRTDPLVNAVVMVCERCGRQKRGDRSEGNN